MFIIIFLICLFCGAPLWITAIVGFLGIVFALSN
jgi:hypothetical protein